MNSYLGKNISRKAGILSQIEQVDDIGDAEQLLETNST